ncbi:hypothetical protein Purlil1_5685 [Purpureocillium lilacinum]|nr:hypothetical protein Purlil1_5685 [Purpureocillium lilacinum]
MRTAYWVMRLLGRWSGDASHDRRTGSRSQSRDDGCELRQDDSTEGDGGRRGRNDRRSVRRTHACCDAGTDEMHRVTAVAPLVAGFGYAGWDRAGQDSIDTGRHGAAERVSIRARLRLTNGIAGTAGGASNDCPMPAIDRPHRAHHGALSVFSAGSQRICERPGFRSERGRASIPTWGTWRW